MRASEKVPTKALPWIVVAVCAVIYLLTCCRTVFVGDAGELSLVLTTGGIAHPPGYPLYTMLGYLWLKLFFFLRPAFAANLFSAAATSAAAGLLYLLLHRLSRTHLPPIVSAAAAVMFALAIPVWLAAIGAEVYALSGLLFIAALFAVIDYYQRGGVRRLIIAALLAGLVMTHHFSGGAIIASLILAIIFRGDAMRSPRVLAAAALAFILPLTLYFYLLLRFDPALPINWLSDRSLTALWRMVASENYQQYLGYPTFADLILFSRSFALQFFLYFGPGVILLAVPGIVYTLRTDYKLATLLLVPAILNLLQVSFYQIPDYEGYLIPAVVIAAIFITMALSWLFSLRPLSRLATWTVAGLLIAVPLIANFHQCNFRSVTLAERYGRDILDSAPPGAPVFLKSDNGSHTALYLRYAEEYRPDVAVYTLNCSLTRLLHTYRCRHTGDIFDSVRAHTDRIYWGAEYIVNQGMNPFPGDATLRGMLYGPAETPDDPSLDARLDDFTDNRLPQLDLHGDLKLQQIYMEYALRSVDRAILTGRQPLAMQRMDRLNQWRRCLHDAPTLLAGAQFFRARGLLDEGLRWINYAKQADPSSREQKDIYVNLGAIYRQGGQLSSASDALRQALDIDPDYEPARYNFLLVKAETALGRQQYDTALASFLELTQLEPANPLPYYNAAVICDKLPRRGEDALMYYRTFNSLAGNQYPQAIKRAQERIRTLTDSLMTTE